MFKYLFLYNPILFLFLDSLNNDVLDSSQANIDTRKLINLLGPDIEEGLIYPNSNLNIEGKNFNSCLCTNITNILF